MVLYVKLSPITHLMNIEADLNLVQTLDTSLHTPTTAHLPRAQAGGDPDLEQDGHRSRFSRNPLVDKDPSFARTPDGRFCELPSNSW